MRARTLAGGRRPALAGALWAAAYLPIHVFWALGGATRPFGLGDPCGTWSTSNWAACVVIAGAGLTCLSLQQQWGSVVPVALRRWTALVGGAVGVVHTLAFSALFALQLGGVVGFGAAVADAAPRRWALVNLVALEPWFAVMGVLLILCARRPVVAREAATWSPVSAVLTVTGVGVVVGGVVQLEPWMFLAAGPAIAVAGVVSGVVRVVIRPRASGTVVPTSYR